MFMPLWQSIGFCYEGKMYSFIWRYVALRPNPKKYKGIRGVLTRATTGGSASPNKLISWFWDNYKIELIQGWCMSETQCYSRSVAQRSDLLFSEMRKIKINLFLGFICLLYMVK